MIARGLVGVETDSKESGQQIEEKQAPCKKDSFQPGDDPPREPLQVQQQVIQNDEFKPMLSVIPDVPMQRQMSGMQDSKQEQESQ